MLRSVFFCTLFSLLPVLVQAQEFSRADTLRGSITPERAWWEVTYYDLYVKINPGDSTIEGSNDITYRVTEEPERMQIDLQEPLDIERVEQDGTELEYEREGNAFFVEMPAGLEQGSHYTLSAHFSGKPRVAPNPPWDGGFIWEKDEEGNDFIATANQGLGASVWWPNKDHQTAEPDSMRINIRVPDPLVNVSNGRLVDKTEHEDETTTWSWFVSNPINNYNVAVNAGNYEHFGDTYEGEDGTLDLDYWVLESNVDKAKEQFRQVKPMLECFERWFGPYPFYEDGFKLVETPHLGMEHQSAIAYGNRYQNGYLGSDISGSGWGLEFDFIIIHEAGHEWWGNNITTEDIADMWVHEGFTNYSENLYVECQNGEEAGADYVTGLRKDIQNDRPITGEYGLNHEGSADMYNKGGNMLHTIRHIIDNDTLWRNILRGLNETFRHSVVTAQEVENYIIEQSGLDLQPVFDQYLDHTAIPVLEYYVENGWLYYRWKADVDEFTMPVKVKLREDTYSFIHPRSDRWRSARIQLDDPRNFESDRNFYVEIKEVSP